MCNENCSTVEERSHYNVRLILLHDTKPVVIQYYYSLFSLMKSRDFTI